MAEQEAAPLQLLSTLFISVIRLWSSAPVVSSAPVKGKVVRLVVSTISTSTCWSADTAQVPLLSLHCSPLPV